MTRRWKAPSWGLVLSVLIHVGCGVAEEDVHWAYSGEGAPENWGKLSMAFAACSEGMNQSPIDIVDPIDADLSPIALSYGGSTIAVLNNGHTVQVEPGPGNSLDVEGQTFELVQFHVHSPSEHRIEGESFPLEAHFVHGNDQGELAVVAVLFREGPRHDGLATIWASAPEEVEKRKPIEVPITELKIIPEGRAYYRYSGSLTTPPCSEGVMWFVLKETGALSSEQVKTFVKLIGENARSPQPLNGRLVLQ